MTNHFFNALTDVSQDSEDLPPVEKWNPGFCGEIDILIKANGDWLHQGSIIGRKKLSTLFSRVLIKQNSQYFLITPQEKMAIKVEWQPFVIVDFNIVKEAGVDHYLLTDNCNNKIKLTQVQQLDFSTYQGLSLPIINVRRNLFASFSRSCYYRLIEQATIVKSEKKQVIQITSAGVDFSLGRFDDL